MDDESEVSIEDVEEREPQITSSDPRERKFARKLRIQRRIEAIRRLNMPEGEEEEEEEVEKTALQKQLQKSAELLEKLILEGNELVTNVRVASDSREVDRRDEEGINKDKIIAQLEEEANAAQEMFDEIANKWADILKYTDPLHINEDMMNQKDKCHELIKQKDEIVAMLKNEIKMAEINFTKDQRKQNQDINTLTQRIEKQITLMRGAYRQELQLIEEVIMAERKLLIEANNRRWEELYKKRDEEEHLNSETKYQQLEEFEEVCHRLRREYQEKFRETRITLENQIENLQQEFEQIKALSLMNSEKLDYNYQILRKREDENIIIKSQQKRRMNKLQDVINEIRRNTREYGEKSGGEISRLTAEVLKLQHNVLAIEAKADHFAKSNDLKYRQVWHLNKERAMKLLDKILTTDCILHEQQLGLEWIHPDRFKAHGDDTTYSSTAQVITQLFAKDEENYNEESKINKSPAKRGSNASVVEVYKTPPHQKLLEHILRQISDKSGFLIERRLKIILKPYTAYEKTLVRIDNVFSALAVTKEEDMELLLKFFLPYAHCPVCTTSDFSNASLHSTDIEIFVKTVDIDQGDEDPQVSEESNTSSESAKSSEALHLSELTSVVRQPENVIDEILTSIMEHTSTITTAVPCTQPRLGDTEHTDTVLMGWRNDKVAPSEISKTTNMSTKMSCQENHPLVISSVYVLRALKEFASKFYVARDSVVTMSSRLLRTRSTVSRLVVGEDVKTFWEKFRAIFNPAREQLWDALLTGLQKYHEILKDRAKLNDEVVALRRQNEELRHLLGCYVSAQKRTPPCAAQREVPLRFSAL